MQILPYKKITIKHNNSKQEISKIIKNSTEPCKLFGNSGSSKIFCGQCNSDSFKVRRIIKYKNAFIPILNGKIDEQSIIVTMRMSHMTNLLMSIWMTGAILGFIIFCLLTIYSLFTGEFNFFYLIGLAPAPIGFLMINIGFWKEVERAELELKKLVN